MSRRLGNAVLALAIACAALLAHVGIDVAGDYLLARDAYDNVDHVSREWLFAGALALALFVLWRTVQAAWSDVAGSRGALRALLRRSVPERPAAFIGVVAAGTLPALLGMAAFDSWFDTHQLAGIGDLLGGSVPLGVACSLMSAAVAGAVIWHAVHAIARFDRALLRIVAILAQRPRQQDAATPSDLRRFPVTRTAAILCARSVGLRAPPRAA